MGNGDEKGIATWVSTIFRKKGRKTDAAGDGETLQTVGVSNFEEVGNLRSSSSERAGTRKLQFNAVSTSSPPRSPLLSLAKAAGTMGVNVHPHGVEIEMHALNGREGEAKVRR